LIFIDGERKETRFLARQLDCRVPLISLQTIAGVCHCERSEPNANEVEVALFLRHPERSEGTHNTEALHFVQGDRTERSSRTASRFGVKPVPVSVSAQRSFYVNIFMGHCTTR
jgi:hypothetical protein